MVRRGWGCGVSGVNTAGDAVGVGWAWGVGGCSVGAVGMFLIEETLAWCRAAPGPAHGPMQGLLQGMHQNPQNIFSSDSSPPAHLLSRPCDGAGPGLSPRPRFLILITSAKSSASHVFWVLSISGVHYSAGRSQPLCSAPHRVWLWHGPKEPGTQLKRQRGASSIFGLPTEPQSRHPGTRFVGGSGREP